MYELTWILLTQYLLIITRVKYTHSKKSNLNHMIGTYMYAYKLYDMFVFQQQLFMYIVDDKLCLAEFL